MDDLLRRSAEAELSLRIPAPSYDEKEVLPSFDKKSSESFRRDERATRSISVSPIREVNQSSRYLDTSGIIG